LHQGMQLVAVVKQPVAPLAQPFGAPLDSQPLPRGLGRAAGPPPPPPARRMSPPPCRPPHRWQGT
jgi:hypothetical protein